MEEMAPVQRKNRQDKTGDKDTRTRVRNDTSKSKKRKEKEEYEKEKRVDERLGREKLDRIKRKKRK